MTGATGDSSAPGIAVATYVVGRAGAPDVVVLPGLCVASYLRPACAALADAGYRAWLVEPPGFLDQHRLRGVVLVGQSVGAQVAAHVAAHRPGLVRHLVLQGPVFDPACRAVPQALLRWVADMPREKVSLARQELPEWLRVGPAGSGSRTARRTTTRSASRQWSEAGADSRRSLRE